MHLMRNKWLVEFMILFYIQNTESHFIYTYYCLPNLIHLNNWNWFRIQLLSKAPILNGWDLFLSMLTWLVETAPCYISLRFSSILLIVCHGALHLRRSSFLLPIRQCLPRAQTRRSSAGDSNSSSCFQTWAHSSLPSPGENEAYYVIFWYEQLDMHKCFRNLIWIRVL